MILKSSKISIATVNFQKEANSHGILFGISTRSGEKIGSFIFSQHNVNVVLEISFFFQFSVYFSDFTDCKGKHINSYEAPSKKEKRCAKNGKFSKRRGLQLVD